MENIEQGPPQEEADLTDPLGFVVAKMRGLTDPAAPDLNVIKACLGVARAVQKTRPEVLEYVVMRLLRDFDGMLAVEWFNPPELLCSVCNGHRRIVCASHLGAVVLSIPCPCCHPQTPQITISVQGRDTALNGFSGDVGVPWRSESRTEIALFIRGDGSVSPLRRRCCVCGVWVEGGPTRCKDC